MDGFDNSKIGSWQENDNPIDPNDAPIPFDDSNDLSDTGISHIPVNAGTSGIGKEAKKIVSSDRITGVKTFCTKLHVGSIGFIDERVNSWLTENPGILVKRTNSVTGMVIGKKTEPYIIVSIWY